MARLCKLYMDVTEVLEEAEDDLCACVYSIWEAIYRYGEENVSHGIMLEMMLGYLDGGLFDYMEDEPTFAFFSNP